MLKFGNREFRNLQEQVLKNMCDIQDIEQGATVLAAFGIKVVGQVNQASDLPAPTTYQGNLGDAFLVGTQAPYDYYIYAKAYEGQEQAAFYNLGQFPKPGPKGDAAGFGTVSATATSVVGDPTVSVSTSGTNEAKNIAFEFGIPVVDLNNYATKPYVNEGLNKKVSRSSTTSGEYIYGISNGFDNIYPIQKQVGSDGVVQRTGNGNIVVPFYPGADDCAASKQYVDNTVNGLGAAGKTKVTLTVRTATNTNEGKTILKDDSAANDKLEKIKVGDPITVIVKHGSTILHALNLVCVINEMPFTGMGQHFKCQGSGYCNNVDLQYVCSGYIDIGSSQDTQLYLTDTTTSNTQHPTTLAVNDKVEIYF